MLRLDHVPHPPIEYIVMSGETTHKDGVWLFHEEGMAPVEMLIINGHVASDDDWEREFGRPPNETMSENYWAGEDASEMVNGPMAFGTWTFQRVTQE